METVNPATTLLPPTAAATPRPLPTGPAIEEAKQRAVARYPQLAVAGSTLNRAFVERVHRYQSERPQIFDDPDSTALLGKSKAAKETVHAKHQTEFVGLTFPYQVFRPLQLLRLLSSVGES